MTGPNQIIRIETGARLHFGLLDTAPPFGGLGAMIDAPMTVVEVSPADEFEVDLGFRDRATAIAQRFSALTGRLTLPEARIRIVASAAPHTGFGSGTQLSLAIAEGLRHFDAARLSDEDLAVRVAGRGKRSAVGAHGFFHGGMIFETGDQDRVVPDLNPIERRMDLPAHWRLVTLHPSPGGESSGGESRGSEAVSGAHETNQFARLRSTGGRCRDELRRRITEEILPTAERGDFAAFAEAIEAYNHASGMLFAAAQGGAYNGPRVAQQIAALKAAGAVGVGQSSWGPGVFAWCKDEASARSLAQRIENPANVIQVTKVKQDGRSVCVI